MSTPVARPSRMVTQAQRTMRAQHVLRMHPCFDELAHERVGRVHLPVAPRCNIGCLFCERRICAHLEMQHPGWARRLLAINPEHPWWQDVCAIYAQRPGVAISMAIDLLRAAVWCLAPAPGRVVEPGLPRGGDVPALLLALFLPSLCLTVCRKLVCSC